MSPTPRVLILGCGFAGLWAAQTLGKAPVEVTMLDRTNHHLRLRREEVTRGCESRP